jgi:3D-(3,5/4)-trihydroxycyclohexane-1,2-dione acylhydrolase (decyclizing)
LTQVRSDAVSLTAAEAAVRYLAAQVVDTPLGEVPYFAGCWAIFGHGNVAGLGLALQAAGDSLPTFRGHNEQGMAHAAIAFAKQSRRRRAMICTTSIGPGATNMVTAAALAHVNRLPVLFLPGDVFASRRPDPVLQQIEDFADGTVSANDCFRPVSRYFDRITRPEQLLDALPRAMATLLDPASCGPVTLAFCQDVQAERHLWPLAFFERQARAIRKPRPDAAELSQLTALLKAAKAPLIVCGGGVLYAGAEQALADFARRAGVPVVETQAGKGALAWDHPLNLGAVGVTGTSAANAAAAEADLIIGLGTRLQDFTTGSRALFAAPGRALVQVNTSAFDAAKHGALAVVGDAGEALSALAEQISDWTAPPAWTDRALSRLPAWNADWAKATAATDAALPSDAQVLGAVWAQADDDAVVVCAAGGLPGELHKLWRARRPGGYHVEYGYSCMGYEIAGGVGVKMAEPERDVYVLVGDGGYLMMNSEIATSIMVGAKLIITVLDNRGFGCIHRLQGAVGGQPFNNLLADARAEVLPDIDFAVHAASLGARAEKVSGLAALAAALARARASDRTYVIVIDTDPLISTAAGGAWWDVPAPDVQGRAVTVESPGGSSS